MSHREFFEAQQILNTLFQSGHMIGELSREFLFDQLVVNARRMVSGNLVMSRHQIPIQPQTQTSTLVRTQPPRSNQIIRNPLEKTVVIAKKKLETACPEACAICQETPKYKDAVCTECKHYYCKSCWESWMNTPRSNRSCPTCRKDMPRTTSYKPRATKRPLIIIEDDD